MFAALFAMLAYYGFMSDGKESRPARRTPILFLLSALLLLMTVFSGEATRHFQMLRPDWSVVLRADRASLNTSDPTLYSLRYLHIYWLSLWGGLMACWRAQRRDPEVEGPGRGQRAVSPGEPLAALA